jgi:uncharacterized phage-associated protein
MTQALDIAQYFLARAHQERGEVLSALKLQKLVYYAQAWSLVFRQQPLFADPIEAWQHGPVVRSLWKLYPILTQNIESGLALPTFSMAEQTVLQQVWQSYADQSARSLSNLTHTELPWLRARQGVAPNARSRNAISPTEMRSYYQRFVDTDYLTQPCIHPTATQLRAPQRQRALMDGIDMPHNRDRTCGSNLTDTVEQVRSPQSRFSTDQRHRATAALAALRRRKALGDRQPWAERLAQDVAHAVD